MSKGKEFPGTAVFFGPPDGAKLDPRFPVPVTIQYGDGTRVNYVSIEEMRTSRAELMAEVEKYRVALKAIGADATDDELPNIELDDDDAQMRKWMKLSIKRRNIAREALGDGHTIVSTQNTRQGKE